MIADGFHNILLPFRGEILFLLACMKSLINSANSSSSPSQEASAGFEVIACDSETHSESCL
jgi:hypothetical protein